MFDFKDLKKDIQKYFDDGGAHSFDHTQRVCDLAITIAHDEEIDPEVLKAAALLHDIARLKQWKKEIKCHAEEGAKMAPEILKKHGFSEEKINKVVHCIQAHRKSKELNPETREAEILQDADRLDVLGAIGIMRVIAHYHNLTLFDADEKEPTGFKFNDQNKEPKTIYNYMFNLTYLQPSTFRTKKAKEICKSRLKFLNNYLKQFKKEWQGEI
ncbi:HD domain-containing protein [Nanoarchaeota archaeon]